jgi:drug/metabolite transporter (DMT)-like permease
LTGVSAKLALDAGAGLSALLALRCTIAAGLVLAVLRGRLVELIWRPGRATGGLLLAGVAFIAAGYLEYAAYRYLPIAYVVLVLFLLPVWLAIAEWVGRGRGVGLAGGLSIVSVLSGMALLVRAGAGPATLRGLVLALGASLLFGVFYLLVQRGIAQVGALPAVGVILLPAALITLVAALATHSLVAALQRPRVVEAALLLGVVATALALGFLFMGIDRVGAFKAAVIGAVEPVFAAILAWVLRGEALTALQLAGAALVIAGTLIVQLPRRITPVGESPP